MDELGNWFEVEPGFPSSRLRKSRSIRPSSASIESGCVRSVHPDRARRPGKVASPPDDDRSSHRRAGDRCIAGGVRQPVQLEVDVEVQQHCFQRQSISRGRATLWLPTFARMSGSKRRRPRRAPLARAWEQQSGGCHAPAMHSQKQASAGSTRDAWFATGARAAWPDRLDCRRLLNCARATTASPPTDDRQLARLLLPEGRPQEQARLCLMCPLPDDEAQVGVGPAAVGRRLRAPARPKRGITAA
jgi:hypothetical protein